MEKNELLTLRRKKMEGIVIRSKQSGSLKVKNLQNIFVI
jgi:hypothetical protein